LNCDERYCVLGVLSDGKWIRGVLVPLRVVIWVIWQLDTRRTGAITCCDVGDMAMEYMETTGGT
jgi:hypothetical protein